MGACCVVDGLLTVLGESAATIESFKCGECSGVNAMTCGAGVDVPESWLLSWTAEGCCPEFGS